MVGKGENTKLKRSVLGTSSQFTIKSPFSRCLLLQIIRTAFMLSVINLLKRTNHHSWANKNQLEGMQNDGKNLLDQSLIPDVYCTIGLLSPSSKIRNKS